MSKKIPFNDNFFKRIPEQLIRLVIVFSVLIVGIILIRSYVVPAKLKETGLHRTKTVQAEIAKDSSYADSEVCAECHDEQFAQKKQGYHKFLACETCHGPGNAHAEDPDTGKPAAPRDRGHCELCHAYDPARPTGFPQVNPVAHNPMKQCVSCHDPHAPKPPEIPRECSACHGEIARTMSVSPHVQLQCTNCHVVPQNHKVTPRIQKPTKPEKREFCGKCHAETAKVKGIPRVNLSTHNEKYLCWQCHYPHMPEAK